MAKRKLTEKEVEELKRLEAASDDVEHDERPDEQVLIDEYIIHTPIGEIALKPWTYGEYYKIADKIEDIFDVIEEKNIDLSSFAILQEQSLNAKSDTLAEELDNFLLLANTANRELRRAINRIAPMAVPIIVHTTGRTQEEIESLPIHVIVSIGYIIYLQNVGVLGNALWLFGLNTSTGEPTVGDDQSEK